MPSFLFQMIFSFHPKRTILKTKSVKFLCSMCCCVIPVAWKFHSLDVYVIILATRNVLFFFIRRGAKVSEPGKGPNHLGEGWRERNGISKALLSLSFCDHHHLKRKLYCWLIGPYEKDNAFVGKYRIGSFPISGYYILFFHFILYHKNDSYATFGYINVTIIMRFMQVTWKESTSQNSNEIILIFTCIFYCYG